MSVARLGRGPQSALAPADGGAKARVRLVGPIEPFTQAGGRTPRVVVPAPPRRLGHQGERSKSNADRGGRTMTDRIGELIDENLRNATELKALYEPPQPPGGEFVFVAAGMDLQAALDGAHGSQEIRLERGAAVS